MKNKNPKEAVVGFQNYQVKVPNEKDVPTVSVRLVVPEDVEVTGVMPIPTWTHTELREEASKTQNQVEDHEHESLGRIKEITWSGGRINPGEFMVFNIATRYQGEPKDLVWNAYQTYQGGGVVSWDSTNQENPAPKVKVLTESRIDALTKSASQEKENDNGVDSILAPLALILSIAALTIAMKGKNFKL